MKQLNKKKASRSNELLPPISAFKKTSHSMINGAHPAALDIDCLLKDVSFDFGRSSGPGGQHRNRKATSCTATHLPSEISGEATERRRQSENRKLAIGRLRLTLAIQLRRNIICSSFIPSQLWENRRQGDKLPINPKHSDYPAVLAEALDVIYAFDVNIPNAAKALEISSSQLVKIVSGDKTDLTWVNNQRKERDLKPLAV